MSRRLGPRKDIIQDIFSTNYQDILARSFSESKTEAIAKRLKLPVEKLGLDPIDWDAVVSDYVHKEYKVPGEYVCFAGTHMSTIRSFIQFFESRFSSFATQSLLQRLDIHQDVLLNDGIKLNNNYLNRMLHMMSEDYGFGKDDFNVMSLVTHRFTARNSVLRLVSSCRTDREILEVMVSNATRYELNNTYSVEHDEEHSTIISVSRHPVLASMINHNMMKDELIHFKLATLRNITFLLGRTPLKISAYEVSFHHGHQILKVKINNTHKLSSLRENTPH
ncbi:MAG: hypothetical protein LW878_08340 [Proteobacteria bacterium]|nr:hypothetical protein [Pseudomonadota bacterium]